jgi:hypothetical protein
MSLVAYLQLIDTAIAYADSPQSRGLLIEYKQCVESALDEEWAALQMVV